jgi:hypothetical protein
MKPYPVSGWQYEIEVTTSGSSGERLTMMLSPINQNDLSRDCVKFMQRY